MPIQKCQICNNDFYIKPCHLKLGWGKYCSRKCQSAGQLKGKTVSCFICGKDVYKSLSSLLRSKSNKYFCSKSCQTYWRNSMVYIDENHPNWKNGESVYRKKLEKSGRECKCERCGISDKRILSAHHINKDRSNNNVENLKWLCFNCHYLVHNYK